jgi:hypothetical protein
MAADRSSSSGPPHHHERDEQFLGYIPGKLLSAEASLLFQ